MTQTLRERLEQPSRFLVGSELVSVRGSMTQQSAIKARGFANDLVACDDIDWISITDNAGGNPQLAPTALGKPILYAGKEVVIHLTCKDLNRNAIESEAWLLHSEGFHNILAMTGDYPNTRGGGTAKPVFDIDSVALVAKLAEMNGGLALNERKAERLDKTNFTIGAVTTNYKLHEGEVIPQYRKLQKKIASGAQFIINQVGFDARKAHELRVFMDAHAMGHVPLIGNVYVLNPRVAQIFHDGRVPGVVVSDALLAQCRQHAKDADAGRQFFHELAAKQIAVFRGLGYRGVYLGGLHNFAATRRILDIEKTFAPDDWKQFALEISFSRPAEYFFYAPDAATGLIKPNERARPVEKASRHTGVMYRISRLTHDVMFTAGTPLSRWGAKVCAESADPMQGPRALRVLEHASKSALFACKDCGDCSLPEIAFLCPESQCAKNQRNGPCGGTHDGRCEVEGFGDCIWLRAYERLKHDGREGTLLAHPPTVQNQALRGTSSWANHWLGRDHAASPHALPPDSK
ncbi:MAG: methylenetetrahydrofolate reductase [Gemmatimonadetes bacterium]|nr:methylenetetrahydrofolate reductase [Gemmatimonadota bacterium]